MVLDQHLHIEPFQTKTVPVNVVSEPVSDLQTTEMIIPSELVAKLQCDEVWDSGTSRILAITNWIALPGEPKTPLV